MDAKFGEDISYSEILKALCSHKGKLGPVPALLHYNECYDNLYGIHDHKLNVETMPMPEVALHWNEDPSIDNPLYESVDSFIENNILKYTGMSYEKFLELTPDMARYITEKCIARTEREIQITEASLQATQAALANRNNMPGQLNKVIPQ